MSELLAVEQHLYSTLSTLTTGTSALATGVYSHVAPECAGFPYIVFQRQAGHDVNGVGATRILSSELYTVKAISDTSFATIDRLVDAIDALLHKSSGTTTAGTVFSVVRESPFSLPTVEDGLAYFQRGGVYRILVQAN